MYSVQLLTEMDMRWSLQRMSEHQMAAIMQLLFTCQINSEVKGFVFLFYGFSKSESVRTDSPFMDWQTNRSCKSLGSHHKAMVFSKVTHDFIS